jgi:hypothetical protein
MQHRQYATDNFFWLLKQHTENLQIHNNMDYEIFVVKARAWILLQQNFETQATMEHVRQCAWGRCQKTVTPQWNETATFHILGNNFI